MPGDTGGEWRKLHPLSIVVRAGSVATALLVVLAISAGQHGQQGKSDPVWLYDIAALGFVLVVGVVRWWVTRWKLDGATLRIETGLFRRDSRQLPVARIQAVDVVRPLLARMLGLAELRIRLAGSNSASGRLAYLSEPHALDLRARLLAGHHGLDPATPEPAESPVATIPTGRLAGSVLLSSDTLVAVVLVVALSVVTTVSKTAAVAIGGTLIVYLFGFARSLWRRVSVQYGFTVGQAPDGIRIRRGLLGTVAETVPVRRIQAVRQIQPLLWRPFGWCRLEVDIAGSPGRDQGTRSGKVTKSLLPVGTADAARALTDIVLGPARPPLSRPPRRAAWKAPLSYHWLAAGHDARLAVAVTGRVRKVTCWVPLEKVQSIRRVQGPVQRLFGLASVHADAAGTRVEAEFRDRTADDADAIVEDLTVLSRRARRESSPEAPPPAAPAVAGATGDTAANAPQPVEVAAGWYPDPASRHQLRYWDGAGWTGHVVDGAVAGTDPL
jgi:putative membrane protein